MATINLGNIKFNWKGTYNANNTYAIDDVVSYNGSSYVCIQATTGNLPTVTAYWDLISLKGTDADLLNITSTAQGDIYYNSGSAIARLGAGTSGQFLKTQGASANPTWGDVTTEHSGMALIEYHDGAGAFRSLDSATGHGSGDRITVPFNAVFDPYNILGTTGSNSFAVNTTGAYKASISISNHQFGHHMMYLYEHNVKFAPRANSTLTGGETWKAPLTSYSTGQGHNENSDDVYWLDSTKTYQVRSTSDNSATFSTGTSQHFGNYSIGGITSYNTLMRCCLTKLSGV